MAHPATRVPRDAPQLEISTTPMPMRSTAAPAREERLSSRWSLCCSRAYFTCSAGPSRTGLSACWNAPPSPIATGKHRVGRPALTVLWFPEEGPGDILCVKQLLVVALPVTSILLLFDGCRAASGG